ncbi:hypothetical protein BKM30_09095 [Pseudomonas syringae pv. syringae]|nr:hypothetical protein [Pseudomonas syringae]POR70848.1 hypothetical protein BKM27_07115 [Pseudomonas syringae pv. syringae]POR78982.1 hypothetical protein BKM30_09095 [Pseudomonas syringae pv. syringae]
MTSAEIVFSTVTELLSQYQYDDQGRLQAHSVSQQDRNLFRRRHRRQPQRQPQLPPRPARPLDHVRGTTPESFAHDPAGNLLGQGDQPAANLANVKGNRLLMQGDHHYDYDA